MKQRGKRIRPSGKDLVFHFTIASLLPVFLLVVGLFHVKTIQQINWQDFNLSQADKIDIPYLIISFSVAILICLLVAFVFKRVRYDTVKQLYHRQKLAKMILENKWYESEQVKTEGFFKDSAGRTKEKITYFPKMYYRLKNGLIQIRVEITLGKYQDQLLHLEKKLESGLYCELTDKELKDSYVEYTLLYDTIASRISIDEVEAKDGKLRLMKNVWWEYDKLPHMLIAGGTGGEKVSYPNPIAIPINGGWRYNYGNMFYVQLVTQYLVTTEFDDDTVQAIMDEALKYEGWRYVYGGASPTTSFDCSGLTQWTYGKAGINLPRTAQQQYDVTQHIPLSEAQAGDLVFFHSTYNAGSYITHVGIYLGNNRMFHAGDPIGYADLTSPYWQQHLVGAGRIKQ
ncbi:C40 family peptidase [Streptococcus salivarius]|nr:C40 family peptidase [Streptococcus salivarius]